MSPLRHTLACVLLLLAVASIDAAKQPGAQTSSSASDDPNPTVKATVAAPAKEPASVGVSSLKVGDYFRPQGATVSGFINATEPYLRSPCPCLNSLANHGHLNRNGRNITRDQLQEAASRLFNIEFKFAGFMLKDLPQDFTLADTGLHNHIEHDASFVHQDLEFNKDPSEVDLPMWEDLAACATNGKIGVKELGAAAGARITKCQAKPKGCDLDLGSRTIMFGEAALILRCFADGDETISVAHAKSFLLEERFPSDFKTPKKQFTKFQAAILAARIQIAAF